jgi:hypothetical protein
MNPRHPTQRPQGAPPGKGPAGVDEKSSRPIALTNKGFVEILGIDLQPEHRGGLLRVTGQIVDVPPDGGDHTKSAGKGQTYDFAVIDVRIVGMIGSTPFALQRGTIGSEAGPLDHVLEHPSPYKRIQVLARLQINGDDSFAFSTTETPPKASASAQLRLAK